MKNTLKETITEFRRLTLEATTTSSSGSYEQPMPFSSEEEDQFCEICGQPSSMCQCGGSNLVGSEISDDAPEVTVIELGDENLDAIFDTFNMFKESTKK
tara:strand:+ start:41 stop:337 length:297 start_codon:yes stop_codon:yes gene_type:complete